MQFVVAGSNDLFLFTRNVVFLSGQPTITNVTFRFTQDRIAQEMNESFTLSFTGLNINQFLDGATLIENLSGTIVDADGN